MLGLKKWLGEQELLQAWIYVFRFQHAEGKIPENSQAWPHVCCGVEAGGPLGPPGRQPGSRFSTWSNKTELCVLPQPPCMYASTHMEHTHTGDNTHGKKQSEVHWLCNKNVFSATWRGRILQLLHVFSRQFSLWSASPAWILCCGTETGHLYEETWPAKSCFTESYWIDMCPPFPMQNIGLAFNSVS